MELVHLHILQRNAAPIGNCHTIAHAGECVARHAPGSSIAARGKQYRLSMEGMNFAAANLHRYNAARLSIIDEQVEHQKLIEEAHLILNGVLIHRLQNHMSGTVSSIAGAAYRTLAIIACMPAKAPLIDLAVLSSVKRQTAMLQFIDCI